MIKTIKTMSKQEKERYTVPRKVQDVIPVRRIWPDGIFLVGNKFSKTYKFSDINYLVASREDKESMFLTYSELLNSLDSGAVTKITINNRRMNQANFAFLLWLLCSDTVNGLLFGALAQGTGTAALQTGGSTSNYLQPDLLHSGILFAGELGAVLLTVLAASGTILRLKPKEILTRMS